MYRVDKMGSSKPEFDYCPPFNMLNFIKTQVEEMNLKPEYLGNENFKFVNNFGLSTEFKTNKKFDVNNCLNGQHHIKNDRHLNPNYITNNFSNVYLTNYKLFNSDTSRKDTLINKCEVVEKPIENIKETCNKIACSQNSKKMKRNKSRYNRANSKKSKNQKKTYKQQSKRNQSKSQQASNNIKSRCNKSPKMKSPSVTQICSVNNSIVQCDVTSRTRLPSECESEDSFIVFEEDSNSSDSEDIEISCEESDYDDDGCSLSEIINNVDDVDSPVKKVRFAPSKELCKVHRMVQWSFAYRNARKGPWEQYVLDRQRFQNRINKLTVDLNRILDPLHRDQIYKQRFAENGD